MHAVEAPLRRCPACGRPPGASFVVLQDVPIHPNVLWPTPQAARSAPRGTVSLALCASYGVIWNVDFDPRALEYGAEYENSLHFSGAFREYSDRLAARLTDDHDLRGGHVVEIGCGKGEFLALMCERAGCTGVGFDPSYAGEADGRADGRLSFVREVFDGNAEFGEPDIVLCRHVLEHLHDPVEMLATVRRGLGERPTVIYVEVPAAEYLLREGAIWDVIYPHVTTLSAPALRGVIERAGFHVREEGFSFGGQYLWAEASTVPRDEPAHTPSDPSSYATGFGDRLVGKRAHWVDRLPRLLERGPVALWGAGAKGTTFLNLVLGGDRIEFVVDVNPRKHGKYVPGTGQRISPPHALVEDPPSTVVLMNPVYRDEVRHTLDELGLEPELVLA